MFTNLHGIAERKDLRILAYWCEQEAIAAQEASRTVNHLVAVEFHRWRSGWLSMAGAEIRAAMNHSNSYLAQMVAEEGW